MHWLGWIQEASPGPERHGLGDIDLVKSLMAFPKRKPNIKIVAINGFDPD
jgi:hypothetical protein